MTDAHEHDHRIARGRREGSRAPDPADRTFTVGTTLEAKRPSGHYRVIEAVFDTIEAKE